MIGEGYRTATTKTTSDLTVGQGVLLDGDYYQVVQIEPRTGFVNLHLQPHWGEVWVLEVGEKDMGEPMWEAV